MLVHRPLQHESPIAQLSPSARQDGSSWHTVTPISPGSAQARPQQSSAFAHGSPAGRQSGTIAHMLPMQMPPQQSCPTAQAPPAGAQTGLPQTPPAHPSEQQPPAVAQICPSLEQPAGLAHTSAPEPAGSGAQTNEQQSAPAVHDAPSARQAASAQRPAAQDREQQSSAPSQLPPLAAHSRIGEGRGTVSSTSRRQPIVWTPNST
jgi:hypothetical protein